MYVASPTLQCTCRRGRKYAALNNKELFFIIYFLLEVTVEKKEERIIPQEIKVYCDFGYRCTHKSTLIKGKTQLINIIPENSVYLGFDFVFKEILFHMYEQRHSRPQVTQIAKAFNKTMHLEENVLR